MVGFTAEIISLYVCTSHINCYATKNASCVLNERNAWFPTRVCWRTCLHVQAAKHHSIDID